MQTEENNLKSYSHPTENKDFLNFIELASSEIDSNVELAVQMVWFVEDFLGCEYTGREFKGVCPHPCYGNRFKIGKLHFKSSRI